MTTPWGPRPDRGSPSHDRAAGLLVEQLDGPLEHDDAEWLDGHLAACRACASLGGSFQSDRAELRALRRQPIEPPRDLWARTAAALEQEARSGRGWRPQRRRAAPAPMGAAAGLLVVAVVIGATILSGRQTVTPPPSADVASSSPTLTAVSPQPRSTAVASSVPSPVASAEATPISVPSGDVGYIAQDDEGNKVFLQIGLTEVCSTNGADCAPLAPSSPRVLDLPNTLHSVIKSPNEDQLVVVDEGTSGEGGTVRVVPVPTPEAPAESPTAGPPTPTPTPTPMPLVTPTTITSPTPTPAATASATASEAVTASPTASVDAASPTATPTDTATPTEAATPTPTATATAIAEDLVVDGSSAAFSPDGRFLAFTARPPDGSHGPDIYLWATDGAAPATAITADHRSVFTGWLGDTILGSRVVDESDGAEATGSPPASASTEPSASPDASSAAPDVDVRRHGEAFLVDPVTGAVTPIPDRALWRPSVDPTGSRAVYWDGTLTLDEAGDPRTAIGRLVIGPWSAALGGTGSRDASGEPLATEEPASSGDPEATSPLPSADLGDPGTDAGVDVLAEGPLVDWEARWDETGTHLAVWIADPDDPTIGKLSLYIVDPETGRLNADLTTLSDERALPGFAIGEGRLVWATPPGQNAEGSHVSVLAWTADAVGQVESRPADEIVVIR